MAVGVGGDVGGRRIRNSRGESLLERREELLSALAACAGFLSRTAAGIRNSGRCLPTSIRSVSHDY